MIIKALINGMLDRFSRDDLFVKISIDILLRDEIIRLKLNLRYYLV